MNTTARLGRSIVALIVGATLIVTVVDAPDVDAADEPSIAIGATERSFGNLNELLSIRDGTSGVVYSRQNNGVLWALTDHRLRTDGGKQTLFAIDPVSWRLISAYTVTGKGGKPFMWRDYEDMAIARGGPTGWYLYLYEDAGSDYRVIRIPEPAISLNQPTRHNATIAIDGKVGLRFPGGGGPEIESFAIDPDSGTAYLIERRRESSSCSQTTDNKPNVTWRVQGFTAAFDTSKQMSMRRVTGMVARPSGVPGSTQNMIGAADISSDGLVFGSAGVPRAGNCNRDAYVMLRTRRPGESWNKAISRQVQLPVSDPRVTPSFNAEAFAIAPDMSHIVYAPEWAGSQGQLYYRTLNYTAPQPDPRSIVLSAGDIADCATPGDEQTAALLASLTATEPVAAIATLGDTVYPDGSAANFANCWDPSWSQFEDLIYPAVGNHEYHTPGAKGYFDHFGPRAGERNKGYYSYDIDANWHAIVLNSECSHVAGGGCAAGSAQVQWLYADLEASRGKNVLAYWHRPRFSQNSYNDDVTYQPFWQALSDYGAELVLVGHEHHYERYGALNANAKLRPNGIRQFIVGTGGTAIRDQLQTPSSMSATRNHDNWGVLKLSLAEDSYSWEFVPVPGGSYRDSGNSPINPQSPTPPDPDVLIARSEIWKYEDSGDNLGTAWRSRSYADGAWSSGPAELGFGDGDEATETEKNGITTYFRKSFNLADASAVSGLNLEILRDDGAVVYLNGTEVYRTNLPPGPITHTTPAGHVDGGAEREWHTTTIGSSLLVDGQNVVAVEIHNNSMNSSDISFNFYLRTNR
jgi:hypothetical protein